MIGKSIILAALTTAALSTTAFGAIIATATTSTNVRSGPGPAYPVIGAVRARSKITVLGCVQGSLWCQVDFAGKQGWAYAEHLTATVSGLALAASQAMPRPATTVTYQAPVETTGLVPRPAITGTLVAPRVAAAPLSLEPPMTVREYVVAHPLDPVYLNGDLTVGAGLPPEVPLAPVPGYQYQYAYVNGMPVLVEPQTRQVTYVYQ
jgi:uncharacterized protein YraI